MDKNQQNTNSKYLSEEEKLKYLQEKIHEVTLECINDYLSLKDKIPLIENTLALIFMDFRNSVGRSISLPSRYKSSQSFKANLNKEVLKKIDKLPEQCTKEDIDKIVEQLVPDVSKDFFGATFVFHSKNDIKNYCEKSNDINVKKLYQQYLVVDNYLNPGYQIEPSSKMKKFFGNLKSIFSQNKKVDISSSFIDGDFNPNVPRKIYPLDTQNVDTPKKYYEQLIGLLTLLTNSSMICTETSSNETHRRSVSQTDISYFKLVEEAKTYHPRNNDEWIQILTKLANDAYFVAYEPFDVQLDKAIEEMNQASKQSDYNKTFKDEKDKLEHINKLDHLKSNLENIKDDRIFNYILKKELPRIFERLSNLPNLHVDVVSSTEKAKENGFYAQYYILKINNIAELEFQAHSEFRDYLSKEGNSSHNSSLEGKSFDISHLFEANTANMHPFDKKQVDFYCDFLQTVNINDVSEYRVSEEDMPNLEILRKLVNYATSKIQVKDYIETDKDENGKPILTPFLKYIENILDHFGADFSAIYPAHRIERNQSLVVPQNKMFTLENFLKTRVGLSALANLIRIKYKEKNTEIGNEILPRDVSRAYSNALAPETDVPRENLKLKKKLDEYVPLNIPFAPQGQKPQINNSQEDSQQTTEDSENLEQQK